MTILITGGAGYIGSHTALELLDRGEKVTIIDDLSTGKRELAPEGAELVVGDVADEALVGRVIRERGVKEIIHFAAKLIVPESVAEPAAYYRWNTAKTLSLIDLAVRSGVERFIFSSTAAVYGEPERNPVDENAPLNPISPYGASKAMVERILADVSLATGLKYVVLRYFNVAGGDPKGRSGQSTDRATHLIKVAAETALGKRASMDIFGTDYPTPDGSCLRDYIQVSDLAAAHMDALSYLRKGGENLIANAGYKRGYSVLEVIAAMKRVSGVDFTVNVAGRRPGDPAALIADNDLIRSKLGWTPKHDDLDAIARQAYEWERRLGA